MRLRAPRIASRDAAGERLRPAQDGRPANQGKVAPGTGFPPRPVELTRQAGDHRPLDADHQIVPLGIVFAADVHAPDHRDAAVENEQLRVIGHHPRIENPPDADLGILLQIILDVRGRGETLRAGRLRRRRVGKRAAHVVKQDLHLHLSGALFQRIRIFHGDVVVVEDVSLHVNRLAGRGNLAVEFREKSGPVHQPFQGSRLRGREMFVIQQLLKLPAPRRLFGQPLPHHFKWQISHDEFPRTLPEDRKPEPDRRDRLTDGRNCGRAECRCHELAAAGDRVGGLALTHVGRDVRTGTQQNRDPQQNCQGRKPRSILGHERKITIAAGCPQAVRRLGRLPNELWCNGLVCD